MPYPEWFQNNGRPPIADLGEGNPNEIFRLVGEVCTFWSMVDENLTDVFCAIIGKSFGGNVNLESSIAILASQNVVDGRLRLLKDQVDVAFKFDPDGLKSTKLLLGKIEKTKVLRNNIVHGLVRNNNNLPAGQQYVLMPPLYRFSHSTPWNGGPKSNDWMKPKALGFQYNLTILSEILNCIQAVRQDIQTWRNNLA